MHTNNHAGKFFWLLNILEHFRKDSGLTEQPNSSEDGLMAVPQRTEHSTIRV